jgi:Ca2+:H+ antiporter
MTVTAIETSLIVSIMLAGGQGDGCTDAEHGHAAVMIICNRATGLRILMGGLAHREPSFSVEGAGAATLH